MTSQFSNDVDAADALSEAHKKLKAEIAKVVVGQDEVVKLLLTSVLGRFEAFRQRPKSGQPEFRSASGPAVSYRHRFAARR